jgi:hypothetical protein
LVNEPALGYGGRESAVPAKRKPSPDAYRGLHREGRVKRAFLFGLTAQLVLIGAAFLFFGDLMIPMARSPAIGIVALCLGVASAYFASKATAHPSWLVKIGMWIAGFLAIYLAIPFIEVVVVLFIPLFSS